MTQKGSMAGLNSRCITEPDRRSTERPIPKLQASRRAKRLNGTFSGRHIDSRGYVRIRMPCHPRRHKFGYVYEHIVAAEWCLGRPLKPGEVVHHHDGDYTNNAYDNLVVFDSNSCHTRYHAALRKGKVPEGIEWTVFWGGTVFPNPPKLPSGGPHWMVDLAKRVRGITLRTACEQCQVRS